MSTDPFSPANFPTLRPATGGERARARVRGYAEGHTEGFRVGRAAADAARDEMLAANDARELDRQRALDEALTVLSGVTEALTERAAMLTGASLERLVEGAIDLAEVILHTELTDAETAAAAALRRAIAVSEDVEARRVRVSEADLQTLERVGAVVDGLVDGLVLTADAALSAGDAIVEFDDGAIDARIDAALERARTAAREDLE